MEGLVWEALNWKKTTLSFFHMQPEMCWNWFVFVPMQHTTRSVELQQLLTLEHLHHVLLVKVVHWCAGPRFCPGIGLSTIGLGLTALAECAQTQGQGRGTANKYLEHILVAVPPKLEWCVQSQKDLYVPKLPLLAASVPLIRAVALPQVPVCSCAQAVCKTCKTTTKC